MSRSLAALAGLLPALALPATAFCQWGVDHIDTGTSAYGLFEASLEGPADGVLVGDSFKMTTSVKATGKTATSYSFNDDLSEDKDAPMFDTYVGGDTFVADGAFETGLFPSVSPLKVDDVPDNAVVPADGTIRTDSATFTCTSAGSTYFTWKVSVTYQEYNDWYGIIDSFLSDGAEEVTQTLSVSVFVDCVAPADMPSRDVLESGSGYLRSLDDAWIHTSRGIDCIDRRWGCTDDDRALGLEWQRALDTCAEMSRAMLRLESHRMLTDAWSKNAPVPGTTEGTVESGRVYTSGYLLGFGEVCEPRIEPILLGAHFAYPVESEHEAPLDDATPTNLQTVQLIER